MDYAVQWTQRLKYFKVLIQYSEFQKSEALPCPLKYWQHSVIFIKMSVIFFFLICQTRDSTGGNAEQQDSSETAITSKDINLLSMFTQNSC